MASAATAIMSPARGFLSSATISTLRGDATALRSKLSSLNDFFDLVASSCSIARLAPGASWSNADQQQFLSIEKTLGITCDTSNAVQAGCGLAQLLTGGLFFKTNADGSFQVDPQTQQKIRFSPLSMLSKVTRLASKVLGTVKFMGSPSLPIYRLGGHAKGLGLAATAFGTVSSAFDVAENTRDIFETAKQAPSTQEGTSKETSFSERLTKARKSMFALLCSIFDFLAQAFIFITETVSTVFMGMHTAFVVGIFCFLSALGNILLAVAS
ncbi:hypothetical protein [Chlamydia suis]|uniref:hypothetical protein n=1 Tax=Chlamydia suis TaxID=83559 RepID=UPI0009AF4464|nr:hypothetical protein [Chlamydia suis]